MTRTSSLLAAAVLLNACAGKGADKTSAADSSNIEAASGCASADSSTTTLAVLDYIMTADPRPQRFLTAAGTDSALPPDGLKVLQEKGPTFFYAGNEGSLKKLRDKLEYDGPYATMLVVIHKHDTSGDGLTEQVTVAGHYIANQLHGQSAPPRTFEYRCQAGHWTRPGGPPTPVAAPNAAKDTTKK